MADLARKHTDRLKEIKKSVEEAQMYFRPNVDRYNKFMKFVFKSSLTDDEASTLAEIGRPTIEFNVLESLISRQRGEFAKQQPSCTVRAADGIPLSMIDEQFLELLSTIEAHLKSVFADSQTDMLGYNIYTDQLAGGFSVAKVYTDYINEMSFEQNIFACRVFDPTLCVFDPLARESHKGDGRFCGELYPMKEDEFKETFGEEAAKEMKYSRDLSGFHWSFKNEEQKIVLVCDYYEKQKKKETIIKLSNGHVVTTKKYKMFLEMWAEEGIIEQPPIPIGEPRTTEIEKIVRYRITENKILDFTETDYKYLPLVFIDGNSVMIKDGGSYSQMTRPFVYHAEGIQKLKNFAGQSLANELENMVQHKFVVAIESVPEDYLTAYQNVQKMDTLLYSHFLDSDNPNVTLPPPREIVRTPIPPEISNTFQMSDEMTQAILGTYNTPEVKSAALSGVALARGAIQSNNAVVPYIVGYIKGMNRIAQIIIDLIPKYYRTPRTLPIITPEGKRSYKEINKKGALYMNYDPNTLQVKVEAGVNFEMQKEIAMQTVISLTQASPIFAQFFNEFGLQTILDNIDIRGIEELKVKAEEFQQKVQQQSQQQQQAQQAQMQVQQQQTQMQMAGMQKELQAPSQGQIAMMKLQEESKVNAAEIAIKERDSETKFLDLLARIQNLEVEAEMSKAKADAENARTAVDMAINVSKHHHEINQKESENEGKE